jgi:predicted O-methyltransferase YrrM
MTIEQVLILFFCSLLHATDLDDFLIGRGYHLTPAGTAVNEGYITSKQREAFIANLNCYEEIQKIAEVGFNAGHTSEIFLQHVPKSKVVSFDINKHRYTNAGVEFISGKYQARFEFVEGDSQTSIRDYFIAHPQEKFDLIYIDGCHQFETCLNDILNFKLLAHKNSILWVDDFNFPDVQRAVEFAEQLRIIQVVKSEYSADQTGFRAWVEARYR